MGQVIQIADFRKRRNKSVYSRIEELERAVAYWDRLLRNSPDVHTREQAVIRAMEIKMEIVSLKELLGVV